MVNDHISRHIDEKIVATDGFAQTILKLQNRETDPYSVVDNIVNNVLK